MTAFGPGTGCRFTHKGTITIAAGYSDAEQLLYIDVEDTGKGSLSSFGGLEKVR